MYKDNTGFEVLKDEFKKLLILHIPHSKMKIPYFHKKHYLDKNIMVHENHLLTDHATDKIFNIKDVDKVIFPYSRIFCDVERYDDLNEEMYKFGRGFYYTKTDSQLDLRKENEKIKKKVYNKHYLKHHNKLRKLTKKKLNSGLGMAIIIDCHSFTDIPFNTDFDKNSERPDICIGTDSLHTPKWLIDMFTNHFHKEGFDIKINSPYSGTMVPMGLRNTNNLYSIMIEINRKLYMKDNYYIDIEKVNKLNKIINSIFE